MKLDIYPKGTFKKVLLKKNPQKPPKKSPKKTPINFPNFSGNFWVETFKFLKDFLEILGDKIPPFLGGEPFF